MNHAAIPFRKKNLILTKNFITILNFKNMEVVEQLLWYGKRYIKK